MNSKAQILTLLFSLIVFIILWALFFGKWIADAGQNYIDINGTTGLEAFLIANMNIWVFAGLIIGTITTLYIGGSQ